MTARPAPIEPPRRGFLRALGPGLITGASDDDPSGIGTYAQVGAQFGYALSWTLLFSFPLMSAVQMISARIGRVTGRGIAANIRRHYPPWLLHFAVATLVVANVVNLGADLGAMGDALRLLVGGPALVYAAGFGLLCALLEIFLSYGRYVTVLKWTTLSLFAYVATALVVEVPWRAVAWSTLVPDLRLDHNYITAFVAVMGTTISPYLFFWQSSQEAEDERANPAAHPLILTPREAPRELRRIEFDTTIGMALSNLVALSIVVTTAATLNAAGTTDIASSGEAAQALRPLAGPLAFVLFALGIVGTGMLAVPVLAGSAAYAIGEARRWPVGLGRRPREARAFYGTIAAATLIGVAINLLGLDPIKALFWSAVVNMGATAIGMVATAF